MRIELRQIKCNRRRWGGWLNRAVLVNTIEKLRDFKLNRRARQLAPFFYWTRRQIRGLFPCGGLLILSHHVALHSEHRVKFCVHELRFFECHITNFHLRIRRAVFLSQSIKIRIELQTNNAGSQHGECWLWRCPGRSLFPV